MIKVLSVFGTRPEAIKMAPVVKELARHPDQIVSRLCVTAQHRHLLDQVLGLFSLVPDYDLDLMCPAQSPAQLAGAVLSKLEPILTTEQPDWVLVQGDTTTTVAACLVAFYAGVKVGHVEAGLRTHDKRQPFPEEMNRRIASVVADLHFAPSERARDCLLRENVPADRVVVTGNPVIDALHIVGQMPYRQEGDTLADVVWEKRILLVTVHRRENFGPPLASICNALQEIARRFDDVHIVFPVHPNPQVWQPVHRLLAQVPGITLLPPLDYLSLVHLLKRSYLVLTDSGGLQEEAPSLGIPVLVLRNTTERVETVEAGASRLVGLVPQHIVDAASDLLGNAEQYAQMARAVHPFGDGRAAQRIVAALKERR